MYFWKFAKRHDFSAGEICAKLTFAARPIPPRKKSGAVARNVRWVFFPSEILLGRNIVKIFRLFPILCHFYDFLKKSAATG